MSAGVSYDRWKKSDHDTLPDVILASGPETQLKESFVDDLLDKIDGDPEVVSYYADEISSEDLLQELRGQGLFNENKWVLLKRLNQKRSGGGRELNRYMEVLEEYIEDPEPGTRLVLFDADHPYRKSRKTGTLARLVEDNDGWSIIFWEPFDNSLRQTAQKNFREAGVSIDPPALQKLLEKTRGKYSRLVAESEKLADAVDDRVTSKDVEEIVAREEAQDTFQSLKTALVQDDLSGFMHDFDDYWRRNESPPRLVNVLYDFLNELRIIRQKTQEGASVEEALDERGKPTSKEVVSLYEKGVNWVRKGLPRSFYRNLYEAEKDSKYASDGMDRRSVEMALLRLVTLRGTR